MDITGASDPYVKIKLLDSKVGLKPQLLDAKVRIKLFNTKVKLLDSKVEIKQFDSKIGIKPLN